MFADLSVIVKLNRAQGFSGAVTRDGSNNPVSTDDAIKCQ